MPAPVGLVLPVGRWRRVLRGAVTVLWCCMLAFWTQAMLYHYFHRATPERDEIVSRVDVSTTGTTLTVIHKQEECELEAWVFVGDRRTSLGAVCDVGERQCSGHISYPTGMVPEILDRIFEPGYHLEVRYRSFCGPWKVDKRAMFNRVEPTAPKAMPQLRRAPGCGKRQSEA